MPSDERTTLRVFGYGDIDVEQARQFFDALEHAYDSICFYESFLHNWVYRREYRHFLRDRSYDSLIWRANEDERRQFVTFGNRLILKGAVLQSPGFWDFFGKLNPLEVIRLYLCDRHERRKDLEYRERAEEERLRLENAIKKAEIYRSLIQTLKDANASEAELASVRRSLIHDPLTRLGLAQDQGTIQRAEIINRDRPDSSRISDADLL